MPPLRLAVVGCGKVSERFHLPVVAQVPRFVLHALVDRDRTRATRLAALHGVPHVVDSVADLPGLVDAAIVATPHHLHAEMACALLRQGVHVLVEKPMALDVAACDAMIEAAAVGGSVLAVGLVRRYYPAASFVKDVLEDGVIGRVREVDAREGAVFGWQVVTDATFRREQGGGVLADIGSHVLDLLAWWLGDPVDVTYADDNLGGVEAECEIDLGWAGDLRGRVELSRTRLLRNTIRIVGERGRIEIGHGFDPEVRLEVGGRGRNLGGHVAERGRARPVKLEELFVAQLVDLARAIDDVAPPFVDGTQGRRSIALVEACRRVRRPLELPWLRPDAAPTDTAAVVS